jgi:hypothetical protein
MYSLSKEAAKSNGSREKREITKKDKETIDGTEEVQTDDTDSSVQDVNRFFRSD